MTYDRANYRPASRRPSQPREAQGSRGGPHPHEDGLRLIVTENQKGSKGKCVLPRISKATGGPLPGIELTDLSMLQEIDDLDYIRRKKNFK
jgi:hypothetical protein